MKILLFALATCLSVSVFADCEPKTRERLHAIKESSPALGNKLGLHREYDGGVPAIDDICIHSKDSDIVFALSFATRSDYDGDLYSAIGAYNFLPEKVKLALKWIDSMPPEKRANEKLNIAISLAYQTDDNRAVCITNRLSTQSVKDAFQACL